MTESTPTDRRTPPGVLVVGLLFVFYGAFWVLTGLLAGSVANGPVVALSVGVAFACFLLAYALYVGSQTAWWLALLVVGASTAWRFALVAAGDVQNLTNALVGFVVALYLIVRRDYFRSTPR